MDATNLERNLYLTVQLLELEAKVVMALNMMDEAASRNHHIDVKKLSELLRIPIVPTVANRNRGTKELLEAIIAVAEGRAEVGEIQISYGKEIEDEIATLEKLLSTTSLALKYSPRWLAVKLLENDEEVIKKIVGVKA
ncbi:MAG: hypothetical protein DRI26_02075 [Chloroflexi bacterium]|nr:MAG: hypothetical protein DRI26_02075 [Chloroflexota bacterium]